MSNPYQIQDKQPTQYGYANQGSNPLQPLVDQAFWLQLMGWGMLIHGCITSLSIIGAIIGVPMAIMGYSLKEAGNQLKSGHINQPQVQFEMAQSLGRYFLIAGILFAISLAFLLLYIAFLILIFFMAILAAGAN